MYFSFYLFLSGNSIYAAGPSEKLYDIKFPVYQPTVKYWMPKWVECGGDPSGRIMKVFEK